jgi:hypothetical protein
MAFSQCVSYVLRLLVVSLVAVFIPVAVRAQSPQPPVVAPADSSPAAPLSPAAPSVQSPAVPPVQPAVPPPVQEDKRVLGVLPNYRTAEMMSVYRPVTAKYKLQIALKDSFDYPLLGVAAIYSSIYQLENSHPQFGQGTKGYFSRLGTSYSDQVVGNMLAEGILPALFHEDPRYFRMNQGKPSKRLVYAISRIFITKTDSGHSSFNFAEVLGNGMAAGIGLSYYSDDRDVGDYLQNWGTQLGTDALSQVLKEFWPDVKRWYHNRHLAKNTQTP